MSKRTHWLRDSVNAIAFLITVGIHASATWTFLEQAPWPLVVVFALAFLVTASVLLNDHQERQRARTAREETLLAYGRSHPLTPTGTR